MSKSGAARSVGVVVAFGNRDLQSVVNLLRTLGAQTRLPEAVALVNFGNPCPPLDTDTPSFRYIYRHLPQGRPWSLSLAKNQGVRLLPPVETLLFLDADLLLAPDFIESGLQRLEPGVLVNCRILDLPRGGVTSEVDVVRDFERLKLLATRRAGTTGVGACQWLRTRAFSGLRGHDEAFKMWFFADMDFQRRASWFGLRRVCLEDETTVMHQWHRPKDDVINDIREPEAEAARHWHRENLARLKNRAAEQGAGKFRGEDVNPQGWGVMSDLPERSMAVGSGGMTDDLRRSKGQIAPASCAARRYVVFCADAQFVPYAGVAAYSLLANNAALDLSIVIITDEIDAKDRRRLEQLAKAFNVPITIYSITPEDRELMCRLLPAWRLPVAAYYRWLIPRVVPEGVKTVLYLDSDIIVDGAIEGLFETELAGKTLGVCPDPIARKLRDKPGYFNSGVMLVNLERWRELDISGQAMAYAGGRFDLTYADQDALNEVVAPDSIRWLGFEYNYMVYDRLKNDLRRELEPATGKILAPKILHFTGETKPWHGWFTAAHQGKYLDYVRRSPWRDAGLVKEQPVTALQEWCFARVNRGQAARSVGVVISVANRDPAMVLNVVRTLAAQTRPPEAVALVNFGIPCPELETVAAPFRYIYRHLPQGDLWCLPLADNQGARLLPPVETVMFLDADTLLAPDFIECGLRRLKPGVMLNCRVMDLPQEAIAPATDVVHEFGRLHSQAVLRPEINAVGACQWVWRKALYKLRGYDEAFKMWCFEDMDFQRRARWLGLDPFALDEETALLHQWHRSKDDVIKDPKDPKVALARQWYLKNLRRLRTRAVNWDMGTFDVQNVNPRGWGKISKRTK